MHLRCHREKQSRPLAHTQESKGQKQHALPHMHRYSYFMQVKVSICFAMHSDFENLYLRFILMNRLPYLNKSNENAAYNEEEFLLLLFLDTSSIFSTQSLSNFPRVCLPLDLLAGSFLSMTSFSPSYSIKRVALSLIRN